MKLLFLGRYLFFFGALLLFGVTNTLPLWAAVSTCDPANQICNPIESDDFAEVMQDIAQIAAKIGLPVVAVFLIYAGFLFVSARGNEEQIGRAKKTFFWALIGAAIVIGAFAIATALVEFAEQL